MELGLKGKVALISGASKGRGKAIAEEFGTEGAHVSICARGKEELEETARALRASGVTVLAMQADVDRYRRRNKACSLLARRETQR